MVISGLLEEVYGYHTHQIFHGKKYFIKYLRLMLILISKGVGSVSDYE